MSQDNVSLTRQFYEGLNAGDMSVMDRLIADDFVDHDEFPGIPTTKDGVRMFFEMMRGAFPDFRIEVDDAFGADDRGAVRMRMTGTHEAEFMGIAATGRRIEVPGIDIIRVADGRAIEHWGEIDQMAIVQQLGAVPEGAAM